MRKIVGSIVLASAIIAAASRCSYSPCGVHTTGVIGGEMPDVEMLSGDTLPIEVWKHFTDPGCETFHWSMGFNASSADSTAVRVSTTDSSLTLIALDVAESVRVAVWPAGDGRGNYHPTEHTRPHLTLDFNVRVLPRPAGR